MIPLNRPFLPPLEEYENLLKNIWDRNWLTNHGPFVQKFEKELSSYLGLDDLVFTSNGTTALQIAIKALELKGEIITTPYSYVATTSSIVWEQCKPVFADIDAEYLTIDPEKIEEAITEKTSAIMASHVYGNPCDVESIRDIANKHHLKVIYDAAHCFGVTYKGESVLKWGDISMISFHATKVFHTVEGGGLYSTNHLIMRKMRDMMNFGHDGPYAFREIGINGKNSEFHAVMGLCNLKYADKILTRRKELAEYYKSKLSSLPIQYQVTREDSKCNYAYFPVFFPSDKTAEEVQKVLFNNGIECRKYFYPSLNELHYTESKEMPVSDSAASRVICLPFYYELTFSDVDKVCECITSTFHGDSS